MNDLGRISLFAGVLLVLCLFSAGCTSPYNSQKVYTETPTAVQETGATATQAEAQAPAEMNEIETIREGLEGIAASWIISDVRCSGSTCTADLNNNNGNTAKIEVYICSSTGSALDRFDEVKDDYVGFGMETPDIPQADDAFIWTEKTTSKGGVIKANRVAFVEVSVPGGVSISGTESDIIEGGELLKQVAALI